MKSSVTLSDCATCTKVPFCIVSHLHCNEFSHLHVLPAMVKVGDNHWYGKSVPKNITFAAEMYSEAAAKIGLPQVEFTFTGGFRISL